MKEANEIIKEIGDFTDAAMQEKYRDKPTISINEAWRMIDEARKEAIELCAEKAQAYIGVNDEPLVSKGSILSLIKELK